jgi:hypothetical protein
VRVKLIFASMLVSIAAALGLAAIATAGSAATPSVKFVAPKQMEVKSKVTFTVQLKGFKIDGKAVGMANAANRGHLHFSLDKGMYDFPKYSGANGKLAQQLGIAGKSSPAVTPSIAYANLPKGKHTITVFLVNNDHSDTGAKAAMSFVVK